MIPPRVYVPLLLFASLYGTQLCKLLLCKLLLCKLSALQAAAPQSCCSFAGSDNQLFLGFVTAYLQEPAGYCGSTGRWPLV